MKIQKVYKLLRNEYGELASANPLLPELICQTYNRHRITLPKIPNSKIFVFENSDEAVRWGKDRLMHDWPELELWEAEGINPSQVPLIVPLWASNFSMQVSKLWNNQEVKSTSCPPACTLGCEGILLTKRIKVIKR
jgi:hypothetical protein